MSKYCAIRTCKALAAQAVINGEKLTNHKLPDDEQMRNQWVLFINNANRTHGVITAKQYVCSRHFKPSCYVSGGRLHNNAVPTIADKFTPEVALKYHLISHIDSDLEEINNFDNAIVELHSNSPSLQNNFNGTTPVNKVNTQSESAASNMEEVSLKSGSSVSENEVDPTNGKNPNNHTVTIKNEPCSYGDGLESTSMAWEPFEEICLKPENTIEMYDSCEESNIDLNLTLESSMKKQPCRNDEGNSLLGLPQDRTANNQLSQGKRRARKERRLENLEGSNGDPAEEDSDSSNTGHQDKSDDSDNVLWVSTKNRNSPSRGGSASVGLHEASKLDWSSAKGRLSACKSRAALFTLMGSVAGTNEVLQTDHEVISESARKKCKLGETPFKEEWELLYFFVLRGTTAKCLLCGTCLKCIRKSSVIRHYNRLHVEQYRNVTGFKRTEELQALKELNLQRELADEEAKDEVCDSLTLKASYRAAQRLAQAGKPFSDGSLVKDVLMDVVETMNPTLAPTYSEVSLSNQTIARRIADMSENLYEQLLAKARRFLAFSIALDESADESDPPQLAIFLRAVDENLRVTEELLDMVAVKDTTTGSDILEAVGSAVDGLALDWEKLVSVSTDGASKTGPAVAVFIAFLRKKLYRTHLLAIDYYPHQDILCTKVFRFPDVMSVVIRCVTLITSKNDEQFDELSREVNREYPDIPRARFLSKGKVFALFFRLRGAIASYVRDNGCEEPLLADRKWIADMAFLVDMFGFISDLSEKLQRDNVLITDMVSKIKAFQQKLRLLKANLFKSNITHFTELSSVKDESQFGKYVLAIDSLLQEFSARFQDFSDLTTTLDVFVKPFSIAIENAPSDLQFELIELQNDCHQEDLFNRAKSLHEYYRHFPRADFPRLNRLAAEVISMFGSPCMRERFFSVLKNCKVNARADLTDTNLKDALRTAVSRPSIPDFNDIIENKKQKKNNKTEDQI